MIRRRTLLALAGVLGSAVAAYSIAPRLLADHLEHELAGQGFPDARLEVTSIGLHQLELGRVHLRDGIDLDSIQLTPGRVAIHGARVSMDGLAALVHTISALPKIQDDGGALDITIDARDPTPRGWSIDATARVAWRDRDVAVRASGIAHIPNVSVGPYALTNVWIPFALDEQGLDITNARADVAGGQLLLDGRGNDLVVHARDLQLADLLRPTHRVAGTGILDGELAFHLGASGPVITSATLRARSPGTLQIVDPALRQLIAKQDGPLAAHIRLLAALSDFRFTQLSVELLPPGDRSDLHIALRGEGRTNHQQLDIAVGVRGARAVAARRLRGGTR